LLFDSPFIAANIIMSALLMVYLRKQIRQSDEAINRLTCNWIRHCSQREFWDDLYISAKEFRYHQRPENPPEAL
jgi:hypothetical protein